MPQRIFERWIPGVSVKPPLLSPWKLSTSSGISMCGGLRAIETYVPAFSYALTTFYHICLRAMAVWLQTSIPITGDYNNQQITNSWIILPKSLYERKGIISDRLDVEKLISWHSNVRTATLVETSPSNPGACLKHKQQLMPGEQHKRGVSIQWWFPGMLSQTPASCGLGTSLRQMWNL